MQFTTFFFDLDDTLYPPATGLWEAIAGRISLYMTERMGFPPEQVVSIREKYFREYGTTLRGLQANHNVDMDDYLAFVHDVPLDRYIHPDPEVRAAIAGIPARKFIFTNADTNHARRVLDAVGLQGLFDGIIDVHTMAPFCKPMPEAFELALKAAGNPERRPVSCWMTSSGSRGRHAAWACIPSWWARLSQAMSADAALLHLTDLPGLLDGRI